MIRGYTTQFCGNPLLNHGFVWGCLMLGYQDIEEYHNPQAYRHKRGNPVEKTHQYLNSWWSKTSDQWNGRWELARVIFIIVVPFFIPSGGQKYFSLVKLLLKNSPRQARVGDILRGWNGSDCDMLRTVSLPVALCPYWWVGGFTNSFTKLNGCEWYKVMPQFVS